MPELGTYHRDSVCEVSLARESMEPAGLAHALKVSADLPQSVWGHACEHSTGQARSELGHPVSKGHPFQR